MELSEDLEGTVAARPEKKKDRKMRDLCLLVNRNNYTNMSVSSEKKNSFQLCSKGIVNIVNIVNIAHIVNTVIYAVTIVNFVSIVKVVTPGLHLCAEMSQQN